MEIVIALFEDGSAAWCKIEDAFNNELVSSEKSIIRYEVNLDVRKYKEEG